MSEINKLYKNVKGTLEVSAYNTQAIDLKATFSTQDKNTARLVLNIVQESIPFPLSALTATIYLKGNHLLLEDVCEVNKELSQITYVLKEDTIKHYGQVQAELYLNYNQGQALSVHKFYFKIDQAFIDQDLEIIEKVYIRDLEDIKAEYLLKFDNLAKELQKKMTQLQTDADELKAKIAQLQVLFDQANALNKNGDTALGTINSVADSALALQYSYLRHYIGAQKAGTSIRLYFGKVWGEWTDYLDVVVGESAVESEDKLFKLDAITTTTTYVTGIAPFGYKNSKSVINAVEKSATGTINPKNAFSINRNGVRGELAGDAKMSGALSFDITNVSAAPFFDASESPDTQTWARGFGVRAGNRLAEFGISGTGKNAKSLYFGFGMSPWMKNNGLYIEHETKKAFLFGAELETIAGSQTKADQAIEQAKKYTDEACKTKVTVVFSGSNYMNENQSYTLPENWRVVVLSFCRYDVDNAKPLDYSFCEYPFYINALSFSGEGKKAMMPSADGAHKYFYLETGKIIGKDTNYSDLLNRGWVLRKIVAYQ